MDEEVQALAARLVRRLKSVNATITIAESCTGGLLASTLTDISGASEWFNQSWVCYSYDSKINELLDIILEYAFGECEKCNKMDINDLSAWESFEDDSFVVMETGTLGYSVDLKAVLKQIKRVSGGDFLSAGGNRGLLWELLLYKTYDKKLNYSMDPFDSRKDDYYTGRKLGRKGLVKEKF